MKKLVALLLAVTMIAASLPVYAADMTNETPDVLMSGDASSAISELTENLTGDADDSDRTDDADTVKTTTGRLSGVLKQMIPTARRYSLTMLPKVSVKAKRSLKSERARIPMRRVSLRILFRLNLIRSRFQIGQTVLHLNRISLHMSLI